VPIKAVADPGFDLRGRGVEFVNGGKGWEIIINVDG